MTVAIAIVGGFAILFGLLTAIIAWMTAVDEDEGIFYGMSVGVTLGWFLTITLFVLALATQAVVAVSVMGGLALLCGLVGMFLAAIHAERSNTSGVLVIALLNLLLTVALLVLALVK